MEHQEAVEARIRAIPIVIKGPDGHPDLRVATLMQQAAEAMREACLAIVRT